MKSKDSKPIEAMETAITSIVVSRTRNGRSSCCIMSWNHSLKYLGGEASERRSSLFILHLHRGLTPRKD